jgi:hypothetical protein
MLCWATPSTKESLRASFLHSDCVINFPRTQSSDALFSQGIEICWRTIGQYRPTRVIIRKKPLRCLRTQKLKRSMQLAGLQRVRKSRHRSACPPATKRRRLDECAAAPKANGRAAARYRGSARVAAAARPSLGPPPHPHGQASCPGSDPLQVVVLADPQQRAILIKMAPIEKRSRTD